MNLNEELFKALIDGDLTKVKELLKRGAYVNTRNEEYQTPLHVAVSHCYVDIVELLIEHGADVNARDKSGYTPLHEGAFWGQGQIVRALLESGANVNAKSEGGTTPLHFAAGKDHPSVAEILIKYGADINARDNIGQTPLHAAASDCSADVVALLLKHGADINAKDTRGRTPLDIAREEGCGRVCELIENYIYHNIFSVESKELFLGEWGKIILKVKAEWIKQEIYSIRLAIEGDVEWAMPEYVVISKDTESAIEIPLKPQLEGEIPVKISVEIYGEKESKNVSKIIWLKVNKRIKTCRNCNAPVEPGARYCWNCGAKLI
jgi:ankyrin repeat protein/ribosomal protein L40E